VGLHEQVFLAASGARVGSATGRWNIAAGAGNLSFGSAGGTLALNNTGSNTIGAAIVDRTTATSLSLSGSGTVILGGTNTYTGGTTINSGSTLSVSADDNLGGAAGGVTFNGGTLASTGTFATARAMTINASGGNIGVSSANAVTASAVISGAGALTVSDAGTLILTNANTYTGGTTINAGATLQLGDGTSNNGSVTGAIVNNGTLAARYGDSTISGAVTIANTITGSGVFEQKGVHTVLGGGNFRIVSTDSVVILTGTNTYTGGTKLTSGTLQIDSLSRVGPGLIDFNGTVNPVVNSGGALRITSNTNIPNIDSRFVAGEDRADLDIADTTGAFNLGFALSANVNAGVSDDTLVKRGPGTLNVNIKQNNDGGGATGFNAPGTQIDNGTVKIVGSTVGEVDALSTAALEFGGSSTGGVNPTLDLNGHDQHFAGLDGPYPLTNHPAFGTITNSSATPVTLTITQNAGQTLLASIIETAGQISVVKTGLGGNGQGFEGPSNYTGGTTISGGSKLLIDLDSCLGAAAGPLTINNGLLENRAKQYQNQTSSLILNASRPVTIGSGGATLIPSGSGVVSFDASTLAILGTVSGSGPITVSQPGQVNGHGSVTLAGNNIGYTGAITVNGIAVQQGDGPNSIRLGLIAASNNALGDTVTGTTINTNGWLGFKGNITTSEPVTLTAGAAQLVTGNFRNLSGNNTYSGTITANSNVVLLGADSGSLKLTQAISGGASGTADAVKVVGGTVILSAPQTYTGNTRVVPLVSGTSGQNVQAGTLKLEGSTTLAGPLNATSGGNVIVDSTSSGVGSVARATALQVGDATVTVNGNSANNTTDSFGDLYLGSAGTLAPFNVTYGPGEANIVINPGAGRTSTLAFGTVNRESVAGSTGRGVMVNFRGPNFGQAAGANVAQATVTGFTASASLQGGTGSVTGILPYATITDTTTGVTSLATNDVNGLRPLSTSVSNDYNTGAATGGGVLNDGNVRLTSGTTTMTGAAAINSLTLQGSGIILAGAGQTLRVGKHVCLVSQEVGYSVGYKNPALAPQRVTVENLVA